MDEKTLKPVDEVFVQVQHDRLRQQTIYPHLKSKGISTKDIDCALTILQKDGFIKHFEGRGTGEFKLDIRGIEYAKAGKTFSDYWMEQEMFIRILKNTTIKEDELKAANAILKHASVDGVKYGVIRIYCNGIGIKDEKAIKFAALHLQSNGFIRIAPPTARLRQEVYEYEPKAIEFKRQGKDYSDHWGDNEAKEMQKSQEAKDIAEHRYWQTKEVKQKFKKVNPLQMAFWIIMILLTAISTYILISKYTKGL